MITSKVVSSHSRRAALAALLVGALAGCASQFERPVSSSEPDALVADARATLSNFLRDPDQTWIQENLDRSHCGQAHAWLAVHSRFGNKLRLWVDSHLQLVRVAVRSCHLRIDTVQQRSSGDKVGEVARHGLGASLCRFL